jgi:leucyl/phenylalanyl-tRNA---protein transferase
VRVLDCETLLRAYREGLFPMAVNDRGDLGWFSPDPRALIPLDDRFHVPHGLRRVLRRHPFEIRINTAFDEVIRACATAHGSTWISDQIREAYGALHCQGRAHSVEAWRAGELAGGLYGVQIGGAFFGESMFHYAANASKVVLVALVERLRSRQFLLLDTQWVTPHLLQFGTFQVPRREYLQTLKQAVALPRAFA